jgi:hypothetical protein
LTAASKPARRKLRARRTPPRGAHRAGQWYAGRRVAREPAVPHRQPEQQREDPMRLPDARRGQAAGLEAGHPGCDALVGDAGKSGVTPRRQDMLVEQDLVGDAGRRLEVTLVASQRGAHSPAVIVERRGST